MIPTGMCPECGQLDCGGRCENPPDGRFAPKSPIDWERVFELRCLSKQGFPIAQEQRELLQRAHALDPKRYAALDDKVFKATAPFGAQGVD